MKRSAGLCLTALALASEAVYLAATVRLPLVRYGRSLQSWRALLNGSGGLGAAVGEAKVLGACLLAVVLLMAAYAAGWRLSGSQQVSGRVVWVGAVAFSTTLFWLLPITSDLFIYLGQAHQVTDLGVNPLQTAMRDSPTDPELHAYSTVYGQTPSSYGPAWVLLSSLGTLGRLGAVMGLLYLKFLGLAAYLFTVWLLSKILREIRPDSSVPGVLLFAWNPFVLLMAVGDAHNDMAMMALVLLAFWFLLRRHWAWAMATLVLSIWVKYVSVIFLPLFVLYAVRAEAPNAQSATAQSDATSHQSPINGRRGSLAVLGQGTLASIAVSAVVLVPFGNLKWLPELVDRLFRPANGVGVVSSVSVPLFAIGTGLFLLAYSVLALRFYRGANSLDRLTSLALCVSVLAFLFFAARSQPWYLVWSATLAPLCAGRWAGPLIAGMSALMLVTQLWVEWGAPGMTLVP